MAVFCRSFYRASPGMEALCSIYLPDKWVMDSFFFWKSPFFCIEFGVHLELIHQDIEHNVEAVLKCMEGK